MEPNREKECESDINIVPSSRPEEEYDRKEHEHFLRIVEAFRAYRYSVTRDTLLLAIQSDPKPQPRSIGESSRYEEKKFKIF